MNNILKKICLGTGELLKDKIITRINTLNYFIENGGELIDTARIYYDGKALKKLSLIKKDYKIVSKVSYLNKDKNKNLHEKLKEYQLLTNKKKIDFLLTHWPTENNQEKLIKLMINLKSKKKVDKIGLGNTTYKKLKEIDHKIIKKIDVVQIELNIFNFFYQKRLLSFCEKNKIKVFGYSPIKWCKYKKMDINLRKDLIFFKKKYRINFLDICLLFSIYKKVIPIISIKNNQRLNKIIKLSHLLNNNNLKNKIFKFEKKIQRTAYVNTEDIFYKINNKYVNIEKVRFDKKILKMIMQEIKLQKSSLKPIIFNKIKEKYIVLDGKIRCKGLYQLNSKEKIYGIII